MRKGDSIATLLTSRKELLSPATDTFCSALSFGSQPPEKEPLIYARVTGGGDLSGGMRLHSKPENHFLKTAETARRVKKTIGFPDS